jgi:hypothetical protein
MFLYCIRCILSSGLLTIIALPAHKHSIILILWHKILCGLRLCSHGSEWKWMTSCINGIKEVNSLCFFGNVKRLARRNLFWRKLSFRDPVLDLFIVRTCTAVRYIPQWKDLQSCLSVTLYFRLILHVLGELYVQKVEISRECKPLCMEQRNTFCAYIWYHIAFIFSCVRFEIFTVVTMRNGVFWDVTPCGSCKNRRFGRT